MFANDGTPNRIDLSNIPDDAAIELLINEADASKRWFVSPKFDSINWLNGDDITENPAPQRTVIVEEGVMRIESLIYSGASPELAKQFNKAKCPDGGVFYFTKDNKLVGELRGDGYLYPIQIQRQSFSAKFINAVESTSSANITVNYSFDELILGENIGYIEYDKADVNLLAKRGLEEYTIEALASPAPTTTTVRVRVRSIYGDAANKLGVTGLVLADFSPYNLTADAAIVLASVSPVAAVDGDYDLTYSVAQTAADNIRVSILKDGLAQNSVTYVIP